MSGASSSPNPAPAATPLTAAMTGFSHETSVVTQRPTQASGSSRSLRVDSGSRGGDEMSRPEQKPRPAPVITTTRTSSAREASSMARGSASASSGSIAFRRSGRLSVIVRTPPADSMRIGGMSVEQAGQHDALPAALDTDLINGARQRAIPFRFGEMPVVTLEERKLVGGGVGGERRKRDSN